MKLLILFIILLFSYIVNSQTFIKGIIIDKNNNPISNVNIHYKNNYSTGTITNKDGCFKVQHKNDRLICSHLTELTDDNSVFSRVWA